jgi:hypothetical protein
MMKDSTKETGKTLETSTKKFKSFSMKSTLSLPWKTMTTDHAILIALSTLFSLHLKRSLGAQTLNI